MHQKWETVLSKREHSFMGHSHWKIFRSVIFFVIAFLWIVEAAQLLLILYHCVLAMFVILKNCQVSVIFCHCFSLNSERHSMAVYFVSLCPGNFSNSEKLPGQWYFLSLLFSEYWKPLNCCLVCHKVIPRISVLSTSSLLSLAQSGTVLHQIPTSSLLSLAQLGMVYHQIQDMEVKL